MLRSRSRGNTTAVVLRLEGSLGAARVDELLECWHRAREESGGRVIQIELTDVCFVDAAGKALLSEMHRAGAEIVAHGPLTTVIRDEIIFGSADETAVTS
jgi:anti-anti-sigma regulatory factor